MTGGRPEAHERRREWVTPPECLRRITTWYGEPAVKPDLRGETEDVRDKKHLKAKKNEAKGGAMETALRQFALNMGISLE